MQATPLEAGTEALFVLECSLCGPVTNVTGEEVAPTCISHLQEVHGASETFEFDPKFSD